MDALFASAGEPLIDDAGEPRFCDAGRACCESSGTCEQPVVGAVDGHLWKFHRAQLGWNVHPQSTSPRTIFLVLRSSAGGEITMVWSAGAMPGYPVTRQGFPFISRAAFITGLPQTPTSVFFSPGVLPATTPANLGFDPWSVTLHVSGNESNRFLGADVNVSTLPLPLWRDLIAELRGIVGPNPQENENALPHWRNDYAFDSRGFLRLPYWMPNEVVDQQSFGTGMIDEAGVWALSISGAGAFSGIYFVQGGSQAGRESYGASCDWQGHWAQYLPPSLSIAFTFDNTAAIADNIATAVDERLIHPGIEQSELQITCTPRWWAIRGHAGVDAAKDQAFMLGSPSVKIIWEFREGAFAGLVTLQGRVTGTPGAYSLTASKAATFSYLLGDLTMPRFLYSFWDEVAQRETFDDYRVASITPLQDDDVKVLDGKPYLASAVPLIAAVAGATPPTEARVQYVFENSFGSFMTVTVGRGPWSWRIYP